MGDSGTRTAGEGEPQAPLISKVGRGLGFSLVNNLVVRMGSLLTGVILARLLTPADYGVFAVAVVALEVSLSMNELGVSLAMVRWPESPRTFAPTVATFALASSAVTYLGCWLVAPLLTHLLGSPQATGVIRVLCLAVLVDGVACVPAGLLAREFAQGRRMLADTASFVVGTSLMLFLAVNGHGAASMAWGRLAGSLVSMTLVIVLAPFRVRPGWDRPTAARLVRFGVPLAGSSLLVFAMLNVDYVIVGDQLGPAQLGLYMMAFNLSSFPVNTLTEGVRRVSLAGFSRVASSTPGQLGRVFADSAGLLLILGVVVCVPLATVSTPLISFLYGVRWSGAAEALRFLALLGLLRSLLLLSYDLLVAAARSRSLIILQGVWLVALVPALYLGARWDGIRGAAAAHALVAGLVILPLYLRELRRIGVRLSYLARSSVLPAVLAAAITATTVPAAAVSAPYWLRTLSGGLATALTAALFLPAVLRRVREVRADGTPSAAAPDQPAGEPSAGETSAAPESTPI